MTVHVNGSVSVVTHKLIELNKTCVEAILKALSLVMNENRRSKVFSLVKQLQMQEYSKDTPFSLNQNIHVIFIQTFRLSLTSCILNIVDRVDVTSKQFVIVLQMFPRLPALSIECLHWKSRTDY